MGDSAAIAADMPEFVLQRFADKGGLKYTRTYVSAEAPAATSGSIPALTWQERTGFSDPEAAAGFFKDLGFKVEWKEGDTLIATHVAPAVVPHPSTGQPVWFNLAHLAMPGYTDYGDGSPIEPGDSAAGLGCLPCLPCWTTQHSSMCMLSCDLHGS